MPTLNIEGQRIKVGDEFLSLSPEEQNRTVEEIASQLNVKPSSTASKVENFGAQINRGIANTAGGMVDFINPLDNLGVTGSAKAGLENLMERGGIAVADDAPAEGVSDNFARGLGDAAATVIPVAKGLQALRGVGGVVGAAAGEAFQALATRLGFTAEALSGGVSKAAGEVAEQQGAPEWVQRTAEVAAPVAGAGAVMGAGAALRAGDRAAANLPVYKAGRDAVKAIAPMTAAGSKAVAAKRVQDVVGPSRTEQVAAGLRDENPIGLTPAQRSNDPGLLGLEDAARRESPELDARLRAREAGSREAAGAEFDSMGGDVSKTREFLSESTATREKAIREELQARVDRALTEADMSVPRGRAPSQISKTATDKLKSEFEDARFEESQLWGAIPVQDNVGSDNTRKAITDLIEGQAWAQRDNVPNDLRVIADGGSPIEGETTIKELHGLYSQMRMIARSAMSGTNQNRDTARIANSVAEAVLDDLSAIPNEESRAAIEAARSYSRKMHEIFDQGAVGRILQRTIDGDESIEPAEALRRTVGVGNEGGAASAGDIAAAAPTARADVEEYLSLRFADALVDVEGNFTRKKALDWLRTHKETLARFPGLQGRLTTALRNKTSADAYRVKMDARAKLDGVAEPVKGFVSGQEDKAIQAILSADNPAKAARSVAASARKDPSGEALAGLKGAFTDYLIGNASDLTASQVNAVLRAKPYREALQKVFSAEEIGRMQVIARELTKLDAKGHEVGDVIDAPVNKILELIVRVQGAQIGGKMGGGTAGGSIQSANIVSSRFQKWAKNLTNDRARQILMDAIEDPDLMKILLTDPTTVAKSQKSMARLTPYVLGGAAGATDE